MKHLDLFSGIGGFAYAIDQVWDNVEHIFCDNEPFAQQVLKKHWPRSYIYGDIRSITNISSKGLQRGAGTGKGRQDAGLARKVDILTGGFPCQPFSAAGLRRGTADDRHLWPEMLRVIRLTAPQWVIAENVGGIVTWDDGVVFEQVCSDLEAAGYEVQPFVIPAVAVNAPHRRDRVWFVAHSVSNPDRGAPRPDGSEAQEERLQERHEVGKPGESGEVRDVKYSESEGLERQRWQESSDTIGTRPDWNKDWLEVATELCSVDDGLSVALDGFELSKSAHRKEQLKAYGNAIVPQVAVEILRAIRETDEIMHKTV